MKKLLRKFILFTLVLMPTLSLCMEKEEDTSNSPLEKVRIKHREEPIDFIKNAVECAQLRITYLQTALKILHSDVLTCDQKCEFAAALDPNFNSFKQVLEDNNNCSKSTRQKIVNKLNQESLLRGSPLITDSTTVVDIMLIDSSSTLYRTLDQWIYLSNSLQSYAAASEQNKQELTKQLIREILVALNYARCDLVNRMNTSGSNDKITGYFTDEYLLILSLLDNLLLHRQLDLSLEDSKLEPWTQLAAIQTQDDSFLGRSYHLGKAESFKKMKSMKVSMGGKSDEFDKMMEGMKLVSHIPTLITCNYNKDIQNFLTAKPFCFSSDDIRSSRVLFKHAHSFFITPTCLTFKTYLEPFLFEFREERRQKELAAKKREEEVLASFRLETPTLNKTKGPQQSKKPQPKRPNNVKTSKIESSPQESPKILETASPDLKEPTSQTISSTSTLKLEIRDRQERQLKKAEAEKEAKRQVIERKVNIAHNKIVENELVHAAIKIDFVGAMQPTPKELEIYEKIWSPQSARKDLSWEILSKSLKTYGWIIFNSDGSQVILTPPAWFWSLTVTAPEELKIHFRPTKFPVHKAHKVSETPMAEYIIGFLREGLGNNIGLSELVLKAIIAHLNKG